MCKSELLQQSLDVVSDVTGVSGDMILSSCKNMEVVDARFLLIRMLTKIGFYPRQIAEFLHKTPASVRYSIDGYGPRESVNHMMEIYWQNISKRIENNSSIH